MRTTCRCLSRDLLRHADRLVPLQRRLHLSGRSDDPAGHGDGRVARSKYRLPMDRGLARQSLPGHFVCTTKKEKVMMTRMRSCSGWPPRPLTAQRLRQQGGATTAPTLQTPRSRRRRPGPRPSPPALTRTAASSRRPSRPASMQTLAGPGPYTVLVPDDAAFAKLPAGPPKLAKPEIRAPADRRPDLPHPARHGAGRRHRQGDRQRQGQDGAGDHGRRHADRDAAKATRSS